MESGGANYYLAYDQVGTLRLVTDASGVVIKALDYDSFGNIIQDTDPLFDMPFSFAGGMIDTDTGLIRFGFREYCPEIGRWTAKDPILFLGKTTDLYGYCLNDPVNWVDPYGLLTWPYIWKGVAGVTLIMVGAFAITKGVFVGGVALVAGGIALTAWDIVEGTKEGQQTGKEVMKNMWKEKIKAAGGSAKLHQELELIPCNEKLKEMGFTDKELEELGLQ